MSPFACTRRLAIGVLAALPASMALAARIRINGAGATFPQPLYAKWAADYERESGVEVVYEAVGSGAGVERIEHGTVDFGASDVPLTADELRRAGLVQFPAAVGGVTPVVNIAGLRSGGLKLSGAVLAGIFLGRIAKWNAPEIAALNPGVTLPSSNITVVHRSDSSGTTFLWSDFLSRSSADWKSAVGSGRTLSWPAGIGRTGNEGVAASVQRTRAAIGYVEFAYAKRHNLSTAAVRNRDGLFVAPELGGFEAALRGARWDDATKLRESLIDQPGVASWPLTAATFILLRTRPAQPARSLEVLKFFDWALRHGRQAAIDLDYIPIPDAAIAAIGRAWAEQMRSADGSSLWPSGEAASRR
jgi:phosphate transport system substrate-binding protein